MSPPNNNKKGPISHIAELKTHLIQNNCPASINIIIYTLKNVKLSYLALYKILLYHFISQFHYEVGEKVWSSEGGGLKGFKLNKSG